MADIANLARHLLMTEVLQICEHVHKQVEEKKIKVYQKGDVHTIVSSQQAPVEDSIPEAYVVTLQDDGQAVVTQGRVAVTGEQLAFVETPEGAYIQQQMIVAAPVVAEAVTGDKEHHGKAVQNDTVTLVTQGTEVQPGETVTLITGGTEGMETETMTVVTHSGQAGASESLAMVSACLAMEQPPAPETAAFVIHMDPEKAPSEAANLESAAVPETAVPPEEAESAPKPQKRKRGRPAKVKKDVELEPVPMEEEAPSADESQGDQQESLSDDLNRRRLRQRSIAEGGYARLHMGLEEEEEEKSATPPRAVTPKVCCHPRPAKHLDCSRLSHNTLSGFKMKVCSAQMITAVICQTFIFYSCGNLPNCCSMFKLKVITDRYIKQECGFRLLQDQARGEDPRSIQFRVRVQDSLSWGDPQRESQRLIQWTARQWKRSKLIWNLRLQLQRRPVQRAPSPASTRVLTVACPSRGDTPSLCTRSSTRNLVVTSAT